MAAEKGGRGSVLFTGYRSLGMYSNHIPHVVRYHKKHKEFYLVTAVGKSFLTYNVNRLGQVAVSNALPENINCLAADRMLVFASHGNLLKAFARNKEVIHTYKGHDAEIHLVLPFGDHVISVDTSNTVIIWDVQSQEEYLQLNFDKSSFDISAIMHPSTYMNKVLLGSQQGSLQLWNVKSNKLLFSFPGWKMGVTVLQQAPAVDVVAVGLTSGKIVIHNIKFDETLMTFQQDWGPITAISFRTDGHPIMAAGSPIGHIGLWDLEEKKLMSQMREAHSTAIAGLTYVHGEPLLITNGADNAIRVWMFDGPGGQGRLLRFRLGHSAPPTFIRHHGQDGQHILSAGQDGAMHSFSTVHDRYSKSLGHGSVDKAKARKVGLRCKSLRLPPVVSFASETARQSDWDGIIACHQQKLFCTTWNFIRSTMGTHKLKPPNLLKNKTKDIHATAVEITSCGNFVVIGLSAGNVDVYNIQSGIHRGCYGKERAHDGAIRGVVVDGLNQMTITAGSDKLIKLWKFKSKQLMHTVDITVSPTSIMLHRESGMLAVALDDFTIKVFDIETCKLVRRFPGHNGKINDMTYSPDGRWLMTASMDCTIKVWDFPSGCLIDCFLLDSPAVSLTMSPTGDYLSTAHVDDLAIYLWSNKSLFSLISLRPLPSNYEPIAVMLPGAADEVEEDVIEVEDASEDMMEYESPEQLGEQLVTLSLLPESRWKNLLNLDVIKRRNKPKEPPKLPKSAPFFIPTLPGLVPRFGSEAQVESPQSKIVNLGVLEQKSAFCVQLEESLEHNNYDIPLKTIKDLGPSAIETEIRNLAPEGGGSVEVMKSFLKMIGRMLETKLDFELAQAYLALFLKIHLRFISSQATLLEDISTLSASLEETWLHMQTLFNQSLCVLNYMKSALL
ncbi:WD repeat-containing protein 36 isoform X1 [Bufo gargarizans]|uniref:WD repeat-containing protein 36 isoform X1 n=1 Tax=Bufo gargarizans TaxID=30331 RepID=UPI001CF24CFE|nr:WD repeat-containing protein 36 isoform X1 [Bufo gargarizans]